VAVSREVSTASAPSRSGTRAAASSCTTPATRRAPSSRAACTATRPTWPLAPRTSTDSPGCRPPVTASPVHAANPEKLSTAAARPGSRPAGSGTVVTPASGTRSAKDPYGTGGIQKCTSDPSRRRATPSNPTTSGGAGRRNGIRPLAKTTSAGLTDAPSTSADSPSGPAISQTTGTFPYSCTTTARIITPKSRPPPSLKATCCQCAHPAISPSNTGHA
jgi:hypothetical protein